MLLEKGLIWGGKVSLDRLKEFPEEFSDLIRSMQSERRRDKKKDFLKLKEKIKNKTLTFEEVDTAIVLDKRFGIPKEIFRNYFIILFDKIDDYSKIGYKPVWRLFDYFKLSEIDKYSDWNKYLFHCTKAFDNYTDCCNKKRDDGI